jgi:hypothetical protein
LLVSSSGRNEQERESERGVWSIYTSLTEKLAVGKGYPNTPGICPDTPDTRVRRLRTREFCGQVK